MLDPAVEECLADGQWWTADALLRQCGVRPRELRQMAENTGELIGTGQGYKLTRLASKEELDAAVLSLRSRATKLLNRAILTETAAQ